MNENQNPEIETIDNDDAVEGHAIRGKLVEDDVEGHGIASNRGVSSGRGISSGRFRPDEDEMFGEDVQGHGTVRGHLVEDDDAVEGHGIQSGRLSGPEPDDTEGHGFRGN